MAPASARNARASTAWAWAADVGGLAAGDDTHDHAGEGHRAGAAGDAAYLVGIDTVDTKLVAAPGYGATGWRPGTGDNRSNPSNRPEFSKG